MDYFEAIPIEGYEWVKLADESYYEIVRTLDGRPTADSWEPPLVSMTKADRRARGRRSDFPWLGGLLVLRETAQAALADLLKRNGELLDLMTEDGERLAMHNTRVVNDIVDEARSEIIRFPDSDRIILVRRLVARGDLLSGLDMFRLPLRSSGTYVSSRFIEIYRDHKLEGLAFDPIEVH